jgi:hypothetical protein
MTINKSYVTNFETLRRAITKGKVCLAKCNDASTGQPVVALCAINQVGDQVEMVPLAKMFDGDPYQELMPPETPEVDGSRAYQ